MSNFLSIRCSTQREKEKEWEMTFTFSSPEWSSSHGSIEVKENPINQRVTFQFLVKGLIFLRRFIFYFNYKNQVKFYHFSHAFRSNNGETGKLSTVHKRVRGVAWHWRGGKMQLSSRDGMGGTAILLSAVIFPINLH